MRKKLITFKVTDAMMSWITEMMDKGNYDNRSELVRDALHEFLIKERQIDEKTDEKLIYRGITE
ncbi:MAG: ribbon-helix-helix domain-containing protein [Candidatus Heimdallarchaeaceae archaeon]